MPDTMRTAPHRTKLALARRGNVRPGDLLQMRQHLRALGVEMHTETMIQHWTGTGATLKSFGGEPFEVNADTLVIAATNRPEDSIARELGLDGIGDAVAARNAAMAIYDGRKRGMAL